MENKVNMYKEFLLKRPGFQIAKIIDCEFRYCNICRGPIQVGDGVLTTCDTGEINAICCTCVDSLKEVRKDDINIEK